MLMMFCLRKLSVIMDAPTGMSSDVWALIQPRLARLTTVETSPEQIPV